MSLRSTPVIPEYITVHLGLPDEPAENVRVAFPDYIKNVASSEIYPNWPEAAVRANILAQDALERFTAGEELPEREEYAFEGETYAVLSEIQTEVGDAGALEECKVTVLSDEETLLEMRTSRYRPERSAS